jgi:hypothetical protein
MEAGLANPSGALGAMWLAPKLALRQERIDKGIMLKALGERVA